MTAFPWMLDVVKGPSKNRGAMIKLLSNLINQITLRGRINSQMPREQLLVGMEVVSISYRQGSRENTNCSSVHASRAIGQIIFGKASRCLTRNIQPLKRSSGPPRTYAGTATTDPAILLLFILTNFLLLSPHPIVQYGLFTTP